MIIKNLVVGHLKSNCFVIADERTKEAILIDPGDEPDRILDLLTKNNLKLKYIVCTHAHFDHVGAIPELKTETGARIVIHYDELDIYKHTREQAAILWGFALEPLPEPDMLVSEGDELEVGGLKFRILHTPGHSPGSICLYGEGIVITGDTLFAGTVGRTDLFGGNVQKLQSSFRKLMALADEIRVFPGHGPQSTIGKERTDNFLSIEM
jgi:hydroxyacylglutathione hydrolase